MPRVNKAVKDVNHKYWLDNLNSYTRKLAEYNVAPNKYLNNNSFNASDLLDVNLEKYSVNGLEHNTIIRNLQQIQFADDCVEGFSGLGIFSGRYYSTKPRHAAYQIAAFAFCMGRATEKSIQFFNIYNKYTGFSMRPKILVIDGIYAETTNYTFDRVREILFDSNPECAIVIGAGNPAEVIAQKKLNIEPSRLINFAE